MNLKITLSGQVGYLANLALIWYFVQNGLMETDLGWPITLAVLTSMVGFYLLIRLGWSRRLSDPSLTVPQMMNAVAFSAVGYVVVPQAHIALLMPVAVTLAFSVFSLKGRQVRVVQIFTMVLFCLTSAVMCHRNPAFYQPEVELLAMGVLATAVLMLTWTGSRVAELRSHRRRQREELTEMLARIEKMAARDALTGLPNRRQMSTLLAHHVERVQRDGQTLTVAMLDLDHFKLVNDVHGHGAGDEVLQAFARTAQAGLTGMETIARWGGEEFLLLSTAPPRTVVTLIDQIRAQLEAMQVSASAPSLRVSFSAGVAAYQEGDDNIAATIDRADIALYAAKEAGRARTAIAPSGELAHTFGVLPSPVAALAGAPQASTLTQTLVSSEGPHPKADTDEAGLPSLASLEPSQDSVAPGSQRLVWLLGADPKQRRWVSRTLMASAAYALGLVITGLGARVGLVAPAHALVLAVGMMATPLLLFAAVRSGWTRRLADPAISLAQILLPTTWSCVFYATTQQLHAAQLTVLVMVLTVGVGLLKRRQAWIACLYAMLAMSGTIALMTYLDPQVYVPKLQLANWFLLMMDVPVLMLMGAQLGRLRSRLKLQRAQLTDAVARLHGLATHDELTGLKNRTHMNEMLAHYKRRHIESGEPFSLALIDLDHFKRINDSHGHAVGDEVLKAFAIQAGKTLRHIDLVARWGGEEFLVLCPQTTPDQALIGLERLRQEFTKMMVSSAVPDLRASFSVGLAAPDNGEPIEATLARVDAALYAAKRAGRNRAFVLSAEGGVSSK